MLDGRRVRVCVVVDGGFSIVQSANIRWPVQVGEQFSPKSADGGILLRVAHTSVKLVTSYASSSSSSSSSSVSF